MGVKHNEILLIIAVLYNIGILFVFKYFNFSINILNGITGYNIEVRQIVLPIGISFYTFQILSYIIEVYRKNVKAQHNIFNLALYVALFPQLIAGPIVRYKDIEKQIGSRFINIEKAYHGVRRFIIGFSKKI